VADKATISMRAATITLIGISVAWALVYLLKDKEKKKAR
jgi:hypothetical protein